MLCVDLCPALAHETTGWHTDAAGVMAEIEKDRPFFDESGGGVTFSGGEPLMQPGFLLELLRLCGNLGIHRAVDTCAYAETGLLLNVADNCELFLIDLKHMDSAKHKLYTGVANEQILRNIQVLAEKGSAMVIRIPLLEGFNGEEENMRRSAEFLTALPGPPPTVDLLPYHSIAGAKYRKLGLEDPGGQFGPLHGDRLEQCRKILTDMKLKVQVGG
jgi:pyruvate formate lyase activating enzyme